MSVTPPVLSLYGTPCTVCWQPARELVMYTDVHVVVHAHRQQHCRIPAPTPSEKPLPQPPVRPQSTRFGRPTGRPIVNVALPGGAS